MIRTTLVTLKCPEGLNSLNFYILSFSSKSLYKNRTHTFDIQMNHPSLV